MTQESKTILLAEDNPTERKLMARFLLNLGYNIIEATTGLEALNYAKDVEPDIIISDLYMPELDGLQLLKSIKKENGLTPFIIVSGLGTMEDVIHGLRLGAWDYLTKPIQPIELLQHSLERVLERAKLHREIINHKNYLEEQVHQRTIDLLTQNYSYEKEIKNRQKKEEEARNAENEWVRTVDALPQMIAIVDQEKKIRRLNKPMLALLGKKKNDVIGYKCNMCNCNKETCLHMNTIGSSKTNTTEIYMEDKEKYLELKIVPYSSHDGTLIGSIHVFRDITDQKTSEKEKELLQSQLLHAQKLESVGQLAAGIAHEINTPTQFVSSNMAFIDEAFSDIQTCINNIITQCQKEDINPENISSEVSKADWEYLEEEIPSAIQQSREGLKRITSIVRAMKEFSHPGGKEAEIIDINHIINVTVTVARNEWKYVSDVELFLDESIPQVSCLTNEIGQVILNLLVNAAHAIEEKLGRTPDNEKGIITIRTSQKNHWVVIEISDTGNGVPKNIQSKIFDPFFTTKSVGQGTGQGLAIAYDVITNKHNGRLSFQTKTGEGTTFTISLPKKQNE